MSFSSEYNELRKKRKKEEENVTSGNSFAADYLELRNKRLSEDIAPVERKYFEKGAFEDGYQFGDVFKTLAASGQDLGENISAGILGMGEKVVDTAAYLIQGVGMLNSPELFGKYEDKTKEFIANDLYDEEELAKTINLTTNPFTAITSKILGVDTENESVFGESTDSSAQSAGQLLGRIGLQAVGVPWWVTLGVTSFGSEVEGAFNEDASYLEAGVSGAISAGAEILGEKLFGGSGLGEKGLINLETLTKGISSKVVKTLADFGIDMFTEGSEEVVSSVFSRLGSALYKEESIGELLTSEEAFDEYLESFIGGMALGGVANAGNVTDSIKTGRDYRTGLTDNEQKVFDKVYEDRIAEAEKDGKKLTKNEKAKIYDEVLNDMEMGYIDTDTIESVLGGDTYKFYQEAIANEEALQKEYDALYKMKNGEKSDEQIDRQAELKRQLDELKANDSKGQLKTLLGEEVFGLAKDTKLAESYNERAKRRQAYEVDLSKYGDAEAETVQKAAESGILNNTRRTHEFVDMVAKLSADKGVSFDFTNNEKLKASGFALEGKTVNGYVTKDGITLNVDSAKSLNSVVGHEITHVLEGTELYAELQNTLFEYASSKNDYESRRKALEELYKDVEGADIDAELTADLVGDYLFTDTDFIKHLSAKHRNVFQKIYDEIKYLCKVAAAGSKEARQLERVKRAFEQAYREGGKESADIKYSLSANAKVELHKALYDTKYSSEVRLRDESPSIMTSQKGVKNLPMVMNASHIRENVFTENEAKSLGLRVDNHTHYHGLGEDFFLQVIDGLDNVTEAYRGTSNAEDSTRRENYFLLVSEFKDKNGNTINIPVYINEYAQYNRVFVDVNKISTVFGRNAFRDYINRQIKKENLVRIKKGSAQPSEPNALIARGYGEDTSKSIIPQNEPDVNTKHSFSAEGGTQKSYGNYNVYGDDVRLEVSPPTQEDIAPIQEDIAPVREGGKAQKNTAEGDVRYSVDENNIVNLSSDDELSQKLKGVYGAQRYKVIQEYIIEVLGDQPVELSDGKTAIVDRRDASHIANKAADKKTAQISKIKELIKKAELYAEDSNVEHNKFDYFCYYKADVKYNDDVFPVYLNVGKGKNDGKYHIYDITNKIRDTADRINGLERPKPNEGYALTNDISTNSISQNSEKSTGNEKLSLSSKDIAPVKHGNYNVYGDDVRLEVSPPTQEDIAPIQEDIAPVREGIFKADKNVDDIAPVGEDIAPVGEDIAPVVRAKYPNLFGEEKTRAKKQNTAAESEKQPIKTVKERLSAKLQAVQTELANNQKLREQSRSDYDQEIASLQAEYNAKKKKNTKVANNILRRIERMQRFKSSVDAEYAKRISDLEVRQAQITEEIRTGQSKTEQKAMRTELHKGIIDDLKAKFSQKGYDLDKVLKKAKDLPTFSTVDNTPQRVMEKALGYKEGQILADETVNKVAQNETEAIKWLNSFTDRKNGVLAQLSKKYGIKPGSKESAAAQMYAEGFYVGKNNDIIRYGDAELSADFLDERVVNSIKGLASDPQIRQIYDETLDAINESRRRNAYPEIPRLDNYYLHFRAMEDTFSRIGLPFNPKDITAKDLPTDLNGVTADLKPGQPYFASAKHREGKRTSFDLLGGLERYLSSAKNQIYHIDDIQTLRALRNYIADTYGQAKGLDGLDSLSEEEAQAKLKDVLGSHLSTFAKFLNEEANILAGKTTPSDRFIEGIFGRRGITFLDTLNKQVGSNMVGFNLSSSLTNFLAGVQAIAKTNKLACIKALAQTASSKIGSIFGRSDSFAENNPTIIRRNGAKRFYRTPYQKAADAGYVLMSAVDNVTTEFIVRAKYNEYINKGMSDEQAVAEADKWTSRLMGDRSLGQMPQLYNSKLLGLVTKFQLEVRNQLDSQFYDTIQEAKASTEDIENGLERNAKTAAKVAAMFVQLAVLQHLFGKGFEAVAGYNPAFDIISVLITALGFDDDEESEDTALDNVEQGFLELLEDLPYTSTLTGGRIPISSALPIIDFVNGEDEYGNEKSRWEIVGEAAPYYVLPGGYGQAKKTVQGLSMFNTDEDHPIAGSYTDSGNLRFPVEDTFWNRVQAGLFGQWASENARDYFDNDWAPLKENQIQEFSELDIPIEDYRKIREDLGELDTLGEKAVYISELDLPIEKKNLLINNIADREEPIDLTGLVEDGDFGEFEYAKNYTKYEFLQEHDISYEEYQDFDDDTKEAWSWAYQNPEKFTLSQAIASDVVVYKRYTKDISKIEADKDENGKSVSGSRKEKVVEYINDLDADYGEKIILFKSVYKSDDTYNYEIIDYLNGRDDISYKEMETILKELGFTVHSDGTVTWD